jgi:hypothetical protein
VRLPFPGVGTAGPVVRSGDVELLVLLDSGSGGRALIRDARGVPREVGLPTLGGEPFHFEGFHPVEIRSESGRVTVRVDGVVLASDLEPPPSPARLGLHAEGPAVFDAVAVTLNDGRDAPTG